VARHGSAVRRNGTPVGEVTSGSFSPTLKKNIGLAYVAREASEAGTEIGIVVRDKELKARVVKTPFYRGSAREA
jgi:aminomethyltransferase